MRNSYFKLLSLFSIIILCVFLDQISKGMILKNFVSDDVLSVAPFLNFVLRWNTGVSFSILADSTFITPTVLMWGNSFIVMILCIMMLRTKEWGFSLVIGGALGNIIDRIYHGAVIDFIDFHVHNWHFAVFNIADSFVSIGMLLLVVTTYLKERRVS